MMASPSAQSSSFLPQHKKQLLPSTVPVSWICLLGSSAGFLSSIRLFIGCRSFRLCSCVDFFMDESGDRMAFVSILPFSYISGDFFILLTQIRLIVSFCSLFRCGDGFFSVFLFGGWV
jgi:hypothetical protein